MKTFSQFLVFLVAISMFLVSPVMAQNAGNANMEILAEKVKADKKLVVAMNLNLSNAEAEAFWPVYNTYQADLEKVYQRLGQLVSDYADAPALVLVRMPGRYKRWSIGMFRKINAVHTQRNVNFPFNTA